MQIHDLNTFVGGLGSGTFFAVDNGEDTGKLAFSDLFAGNSYVTLFNSWNGTGNTLTKAITDFDFIDVYIRSTVDNSVACTRVPVSVITSNSNKCKVNMTSLFTRQDLSAEFAFGTMEITFNGTSISKSPDSMSLVGASGNNAVVYDVVGTDFKLVRIDGIKTPGNSKGVVACHTVTLKAADWSNSSQTVSVDDVTANNYVLVAPDPSNYSGYASAGIYCASQGAGTLTFACTTTPSNDLLVNIAVIG